MQSITVQMIVQKIGDIEQKANFSAAYALKILKTMRSMDENWVRTLTGTMDTRIIIVLIGAVVAMASISFS